jgi:hypothetical protein
VNANVELNKYLPLLYDWAYDDMTTAQRSNVLWVMERQVLWSMREQFWFTADNGYVAINTNRLYTNDLVLTYTSHAKVGGSHEQTQLGGSLINCIGGMGESAILREYFTYLMNYMIGQFDPFNGDAGRAYNEQGFRLFHNYGTFLQATMIFPDAGLTNISWIRTYPRMFTHLEPLNYAETHDQFGDYGFSLRGGLPDIQIYDNRYATLARLIGDGVILRHQRRSYEVRSGTPDYYTLTAGTAFFPYYHRNTPAEQDGTETAYLNVLDGWAITATHAPNQWGSFTNGAGMVLTARPSGSRNEHGSWHDGAPQMYAYGAQVTAGGIGAYKHPLHVPGLMVDGVGTATPNGQNPTAAWYSRLIAFTNNADIAYAAGEYGPAMNRINFDAGGGNGNLNGAYDYPSNNRPYVVSVQRHVVMVKGTNSDSTYWLDYSSMTSTQAAHFQWHWPIMERTAQTNLAAASFTFTSTNFYNGSNVTTLVQHIVNPSLITMISLNGTNWMGTNIYTKESFDVSSISSPIPESQIWVQNTVPTTNFSHLVAIGPSKWGSNQFQFTRLDDNTVKVIRPDGIIETNTFGTNYAGAYTRRFSLALAEESSPGGGGSQSSGTSSRSTGKFRGTGRVIAR